MRKLSRVALGFVFIASLAVVACSTFSESDAPASDAGTDGPPSSDAAANDAASGDGALDSATDPCDGALLCDHFERDAVSGGPWTSAQAIPPGTLSLSDQPLFHGQHLVATADIQPSIGSAALVYVVAPMTQTLRVRFWLLVSKSKEPSTAASVLVLTLAPGADGPGSAQIALVFEPITSSLSLQDGSTSTTSAVAPIQPETWFHIDLLVMSSGVNLTTASLDVAKTEDAGTGVMFTSHQSTSGLMNQVSLGIAPYMTAAPVGEVDIDDVIISTQ